MSARTMANKYPGPCASCGQTVEAGAGIAEGRPTGQRRYGKPVLAWTVRHPPSTWAGSPVSGRWVGGCPEPTP